MKSLVGQNNFYDWLKHLSTLATGSIVLLATFAEKFPKDASWRFLLGASMAAFLISVLSSISCALFSLSASRYDEEEDTPTWEKVVVSVTLIMTAVFLTGGLAALGVFAIKNF